VNGNLDGTSVGPVVLTSVIVTEEFIVELVANVQGTGFALTITANQAATFEGLLDSETDFEPCE